MNGLLGGLVVMIVGFGGPAGFLNLPVPPDVTDSIGAQRSMDGANYAARTEPYGGCKEAHLYPGTKGARDCGWEPMPHSRQRVGHAACWWLVGDTTYVSCPDGWEGTS